MKGYLQTVLDDSPVLLWALNETSGSPAFVDLSRNGNHAAASGGILLSRTGPGLGILASAEADGVNDSANRDSGVGTVAAVLPIGSAARSMEIWARPTGSGTYCALAYGKLVAGGTEEHSVFQVGGTGAGSAFTDGVNAGNNKAWVTAATVNAWGHFVMTYAGGAGGAAIFYRNGVADVTSTLSLNTTGAVDRVRGGLRSDDVRATAYFLGNLAFAAVYNKVLTPAQIMHHYRARNDAPPNLPTRRFR